MKRFRIRGLMFLVLALAVGLAALSRANEYWAGGLLLATPLLLGIALIGALCGRDRRRAGRIGFAVLGGAYFALAFLGLSEGNLRKLPTSQILRHVHERVLPARVSVTFSPNVRLTAAKVPSHMEFQFEDRFVSADSEQPAHNRWRSMLPGAADLASFSTVGHCLFALLAGMLGAVIAKWFEKGRAPILTA